MALIIPMQPDARAARRPAPTAVGGAQILFFTGVRYARMEEPPPSAGAAPQGANPGKGRKRRARA